MKKPHASRRQTRPGGDEPLRRVALLIDASRVYARGLVRGVARYNNEHRQWSVYYTPRGPNDPPPAWLAQWQGDGILARIDDRRMADAVLATGAPVIDLRRSLGDLSVPTIGPDDRAVARLAAEHLLERGFRRFGFCGLPRDVHPSMDARADRFAEAIAEAGCRCEMFRAPRYRQASANWEKQVQRIAEWVRGLPKPAGIMACNDDRGLLVLDACRRAGVLVPDEVAVVGVGNDDCLCSLAVPPLSSIDLNPQRIGYAAAELLERMMGGYRPTDQHSLVEPHGIAMRQSTDVLATDDETVVRAVRFIRDNACQRIRVSDVLRHVRASRSVLEPRLKQVLGRTIHQEIQRVRIDQVKHLLATTDLPIKQVAYRAGFRYTEYMMRVFRRATGQTAKSYRKQMSL